MRSVRIGILGASGAVGREMIRLLEEYRLPIDELRLLAGEKSAGSKIDFYGERLPVLCTNDGSFQGLDYVLGASEQPVSRRFAPAIRRSGAVFIDNSAAFRLDPEVPLVVPEINGRDAFTHSGIIANPNCSTIITLMAVGGVHKLSPIRAMNVSTYQAVSGAGVQGLRELEDQLAAYIQGKETKPGVFPAPIAMNVIPWIGEAQPNGYTDEEMKMQNEGRKILHRPTLNVSCTCVRVPVMRSHAMAVSLWTEDPVSVENAKRAIGCFPGCRFVDSGYPTPREVGGQDLVWIGRLREELTHPNGLSLWCCGDQIRKGAAANAIQILLLLENG